MQDSAISRLDIETALRLSPWFYRAALDFGEWPGLLECLAGVFQSRVAQFSLGNFETQELITTANYGLTDEMLTAWLSMPDILEADPRVPHVKRLPNRPITERQLMPLDEWHSSRIYRVLFEPFGCDSTLAAHVATDETNAVTAILGMVRSIEEGPFTQTEVDRFQLDLPHFKEAMRCATTLWRHQEPASRHAPRIRSRPPSANHRRASLSGSRDREGRWTVVGAGRDAFTGACSEA
jgi:hypothetical protein